MKLRTFVIVGAILSVAAGFMLRTVLADAPPPGSESDPVVSKSYVDQALQDRLTKLEESVAELTVQAQALQTMLNELQTKVNKTSGSSSSSSSGTGSGPSGSSSGGAGGSSSSGSSGSSSEGQASASNVGKTAYVKPSNTYGVVNLRNQPSTTGTTVVKQVKKGEPMTILEVKGDWYRVTLPDNTTGWVASWVVDVK